MFRRKEVDPLARRVALQIGAARVGLGLTTVFATRPALKGLGFSRPETTGVALAKLAGGRDLALGVLTLAAHDDVRALRTLTLASGACDLADAVALSASAGHPETRKAGISGIASGGAAALACFWAWRRLRD